MNTLNKIREMIITQAYKSNTGHIGSCLSVVDIIYMLYNRIMDVNTDKLILSKGHASLALYAVLTEKGLMNKETFEGYCLNSGTLSGHIDKTQHQSIDCSSGSLGHGLSIGLGMAIAKKNKKEEGKIYVIVGDGELNEGSCWEAIMLAGHLKLDNLVLIIDRNNLQALNKTNNIIKQDNLYNRLHIFDWYSSCTDYFNDLGITYLLHDKTKKPKAIIINTIKGCGVSFMENKLEWHYKSLNEDQYMQALKELK